jgi:hypothetical protein
MSAWDRHHMLWRGHSESDIDTTAQVQGAALHYLDGRNSVKDFDCWAFYELDEQIGQHMPQLCGGAELFHNRVLVGVTPGCAWCKLSRITSARCLPFS